MEQLAFGGCPQLDRFILAPLAKEEPDVRLTFQHFLDVTYFFLQFPGHFLRSALVFQAGTTSQNPCRFLEFAFDFLGFALEYVFGTVFHKLRLVGQLARHSMPIRSDLAKVAHGPNTPGGQLQ